MPEKAYDTKEEKNKTTRQVFITRIQSNTIRGNKKKKKTLSFERKKGLKDQCKKKCRRKMGEELLKTFQFLDVFPYELPITNDTTRNTTPK